MKPGARSAFACLLFAAACHGSASAPPAAVAPAYKQDIANLCDVIHLSGADQLPKEGRLPTIVQWLGPHITTQQAREFLAKTQPLQGAAKASAYDAEAKRVGLDHCALSDEWRN